MRPFGAWLVLGAGLCVYTDAAVARACSCDFSGPGKFYVGADGRLPRDAFGIPWQGLHPLSIPEQPPRPISDRVTLLRHESDGRKVAVPFDIRAKGPIDLIVPDSGLWSGGTYTVLVREYNMYDSPYDRYVPRDRKGRRLKLTPLPLPFTNEVTVTIHDEQLDLRGATVELAPRARGTVSHAEWRTPSCGVQAEADIIDLSVVLPPALEPYREHLLYETRVDGQVRRPQTSKCQYIPAGRSWTEKPGTDRMFSECGEQPFGLTPGEHRMSVTISTPGVGTSFSTPEMKFVIGCALPEPVAEPAPAPEPAPSVMPVAAPCPPAAMQGPPPASAPRGCSLVAPSWAPLVLLLLRRRRSSASRPSRGSPRSTR